MKITTTSTVQELSLIDTYTSENHTGAQDIVYYLKIDGYSLEIGSEDFIGLTEYLKRKPTHTDNSHGKLFTFYA